MEAKEYIYDEDTKALYVTQGVSLEELLALDSSEQMIQELDQQIVTANIPADPSVPMGTVGTSTNGTSYTITTTASTAGANTIANWIMPVMQATTQPDYENIPSIDVLAKLVRVSPNQGDKDFYDVKGDDGNVYNLVDVVYAAIKDLEFFHSKAKKFPHG